ncbi:peptidase S41 [Lacihabitans sp. LS3-19]|uniref:S41 family peptidase n=1 Tax=Lacihabitans sp. LS3-19 TaxID=2487335 RepID=UPI0020CDF29C|nr:S41 family peptidase [Lacihabitans sp. LS3-19]MCP9767206.1 peptidase S41 [Lacihabitans sp. LS3-19]
MQLKHWGLIALIFTSFSCKKLSDVFPKKTETSTSDNPNAETNAWIYDEMKTYYLWESQMTAKTSTDYTLAPMDYFESILVKPGELDRFSWIQEDVEALTASLQGVNKVVGIRFTPFFADPPLNSKVALSIAYSLKGSPADKAGIKRGDLITQVNGVVLTAENYSTAFSSDNLELTLGDYANGVITSNSKKVSLVRAEVQTDPIQHYSIIEKGNKKIGYLVYLQFLTQYDNNIREVFKEFKTKGVNELVLDLRYNGGGYISSSNIISSLIVKDLKPGTLMNTQEWNAEQSSYYKSKYGNDVFDTDWLNESNNLGNLNRVYILTSPGTASASELIINNLKPFMDVILIGDHTYGKNVGSITLSDEKKRWKYGMQPIVLKTLNAIGQSDYGSKDGFAPTIKVSDSSVPFLPFGDESETLLSVAIEQITGVTAKTQAQNAKIKATTKVSVLNNAYPLDNPKREIRDMYLDKLPGN